MHCPKALYSDALVALWYLYLYIVSSAAVALLHLPPCASFKTQPGTAALQLKPNASTPSPRAAASKIDAFFEPADETTKTMHVLTDARV